MNTKQRTIVILAMTLSMTMSGCGQDNYLVNHYSNCHFHTDPYAYPYHHTNSNWRWKRVNNIY